MNRLTDRFGMGKVITAGAALQMLGCKSASNKLAFNSLWLQVLILCPRI